MFKLFRNLYAQRFTNSPKLGLSKGTVSRKYPLITWDTIYSHWGNPNMYLDQPITKGYQPIRVSKGVTSCRATSSLGHPVIKYMADFRWPVTHFAHWPWRPVTWPESNGWIQDSRFKNGLLQFQHKSTWHTFQDWSPGGLICPKYNQIELHNIDLFGTTG